MALAILIIAALLGGGVWADIYQLDIIQAIILMVAMGFGPLVVHGLLASKLAGAVLDTYGNRYPLAPTIAILGIGAAFYLGIGQGGLPIHSKYVNNPVMIFGACTMLAPSVLVIFSLCMDRLWGGYQYLAKKEVAEHKRIIDAHEKEWSPPAGSASFGGGDFDRSKFKR